VSGRDRFSEIIRRPFSPKHEATNQQDRPTWAVFSYVSPLASSIIGLGMMSPI
jgi:hypothetical protein